VAVAPKAWEQVFDGIASGTRSQSRAVRGVDDEPAEAPEWVTTALVLPPPYASIHPARSAPLLAIQTVPAVDYYVALPHHAV
jgi:hypothetical protein